MSDLFITLLLILVVIVMTFLGWLLRCYLEERRTRACKKACEQLGLQFATEDEDVNNEISDFQLMNLGHSRKLKNVTSAVTNDVTIRMFDYIYSSGSGRQESTYHQTVAMIHSDDIGLPPFHAQPEDFLDELKSLFGSQDIDFDEHREFSRTFVLTSPTEEETREFFDYELLDFLASRPKIHFESDGRSFLFYEHRHTVKPRKLEAMLEEAFHVFSLLRNRSKVLHQTVPTMSPYAPESDPLLVN